MVKPFKTKHQKLERWLSQNPTKSLREFRAAQLNFKKVDRKNQKVHNSDITRKREAFLKKLVAFGLRKGDTCVDYGCGTLLIGKHVFNYLEPTRYWGMDIAGVILEKGRAHLGAELIEEKKPNLRVISPEAVAEVAATAPQVLFSFRVMKTVHPNDLDEYLSNICKIIGTGGRALVQAEWSEAETFRYGTRKWAYDLEDIRERLSRSNCKCTVLRAGEKVQRERNHTTAEEPESKKERDTKNGFLGIVHVSQPDPHWNDASGSAAKPN